MKRYVALRKARNRRLRKSLGVAMAKGKMRYDPRELHPDKDYTLRISDKEDFGPQHEDYKNNIYEGTPQTLLTGIRNFRHIAGDEADLSNMQNPLAEKGVRWRDALNDSYHPDELLTHVRDAMKETPYMEDEVNINSMRDHRFELRDLSRRKPKDDRSKITEARTRQRRRGFEAYVRSTGINPGKPTEDAVNQMEEEYQRKQFNESRGLDFRGRRKQQ